MKPRLNFIKITLVLIAFLVSNIAFAQTKGFTRTFNKTAFVKKTVKNSSAIHNTRLKSTFGKKTPSDGNAMIILEAHNVWNNGTGYQMLLDANATAYNTIIPIVGPLTNEGDVPDSIYSQFEYKIPVNADGSLSTQNMVLNGSDTIEIPAGTYDWCITNPWPGSCMWIASNTCDPGRADNYVFETGCTYHFYMSYDENTDHDCVTITMTTNAMAPAASSNFSVTPAPDQGLSANLSWTNPTTTLNGSPLTSISSVVVERNGVSVYTFNNPAPGAAMTWVDSTITSTDHYTYAVRAYNGLGKGASATGSVWVGALYNMPTDGTESISICDGVIFDDGGPNNPYSGICDGTLIINPVDANHGVQIHGNYSIESGCAYLYVYEGAGTSGTLLGTYSSESGTIPLTSSLTGPLTLRFVSDDCGQYDGLEINVSCMWINPNCLSPNNLACAGVSANTSRLTWVAQEGQTLWDVEYGPAGFTQETGTIVTANSNPFTLTGLTAETAYDFYIRSDCGVQGASAWNGLGHFITAPECEDGTPSAPVVKTGAASTSPIPLPLSLATVCSYTQQIYTASELAAYGGNYGYLHSISFQYTGALTTRDSIKVYLANTNMSSFVAIADWIPGAQLTEVFSGSVALSNTGTDNWTKIQLDTPFFYDGTSNLAVAVLDNSGVSLHSNQDEFKCHFTGSNRAIYGNSIISGATKIDPYNPPSACGKGPYCNNIKLDMCTPDTPLITVSGVVKTLSANAPIAGAVVKFTGALNPTVTTGADGAYTLQAVEGLDYDISVTATGYNAYNEANYVIPSGQSTKDISLTVPSIAVSPASIDVTTNYTINGTATVTLSNNGNGPLSWYSYDVQFDDKSKIFVKSGSQTRSVSTLAYATVATYNSVTIPLDNPAGLSYVGPTLPDPLTGADFIKGTWYAIGPVCKNIYKINPDDGTYTRTVSHNISGALGLAYNPVDDQTYIKSSNKLYTIDLSTGQTTLKCNVAIATQCFTITNEGRFIALDMNNDKIVEINPATGVVTPLFPVGADAHAWQDMAIDRKTNTVYWASVCGNNIYQLYKLDLTANTLYSMGDIGQQVCSLMIPTIPGWVDLSSMKGGVPAGGSQDIVLTMDASIAEEGTYHATVNFHSSNPDVGTVSVPVTFTIVHAAQGALSGTVIHNGNPVEGVTITATREESPVYTYSVITGADGSYSFDSTMYGTYDITAVKEGFNNYLATGVVVTSAQATTYNITMVAPTMSLDSLSITASAQFGTIITRTINVTNNGDGPLGWTGTLQLSDKQQFSIPANDGNFEHSAVSTGLAPTVNQTPIANTYKGLRGSKAYGFDVNNKIFMSFDTDDPSNPTTIDNVAVQPFGATFDNTHTDFMYIIDYLDGKIKKIDITTGNVTTVGSAGLPNGETPTGLSCDKTTGDLYASSSTGASSKIYTLNPETGVCTLIGINNIPALIDIAVDGTGQMYGYDIAGDNSYKIDKATGAATLLGSIGFDANYVQGMCWDPASDNIYLAAYNVSTSSGELRILDKETGNTAMICSLPAEIDGFAFPGRYIKWLSIDPESDTIAAGASQDVTVTLDGNYIPLQKNYTLTGSITFSSTPNVGTITVPVAFTIVTEIPVLSVTPANQDVASAAGTTTFAVANTGTGTMNYTAVITSGNDWLTITSGGSGVNTGTINVAYTENTSTLPRTGTITVTAPDATGSPVQVTVTQAAFVPQPVLSVTPTNQDVTFAIGTTIFAVANTGTGTMNYTAEVTSGNEWLTITSGSSGVDAGNIDVAFTENTSTLPRTGTITVTAPDATGSPVNVTVTQAVNPALLPTLTISTLTDIISGSVSIPVHAANIVNMGSFQFTIEYDPSLMTYTGTSNWYTGIDAVTVGNPTPGKLTFVWAADLQGINIADGNFFNIDFTWLGSTLTSALTWSDNPTLREFADYNGNIFVPTYINGSVTGGIAQPVLSVTPANQDVTSTSGTTTFAVANTGTGTMNYTAAVTTGNDWLTITSGGSGVNTGTINVAYTENTSTSPRTGTITVTAPDATGSPVQVTVTQAAFVPQPVLSVTPTNQDVTSTSGTTIFAVANTGTGTMNYTAVVTTGNDWLTITSGGSGVNSGTINVAYTENTLTSPRTGTITITAPGATGSPVQVTVTQGVNSALLPTFTIATLNNVPAGSITVPVHAANVVNMGSFQFTIEYDPALMTYSSASDWYTGIEAVTMGEPIPGHLTFVWAADMNGINIADGTFFNLNFNWLGSTSTSSLTWSDNPTPREFTDYDGNVFVSVYNNGSVTGSPSQPILTVTPTNQDVTSSAGTTTFAVANTGIGTMNYTAAVTTGNDWLTITSGGSGVNTGTINVAYTENTSTSPRTGTITVTAPGATGSPVQVTVTQAAASVPAAIVTITDTTTLVSGPFVVPVRAQNITNMGSFQFTIEYDPSIILFDSITNWHAGIDAVTTGNPSAGHITFVWAADLNGINIADGKFFDINFNWIASDVIQTQVNWSDNPTPREFADYDGNIFVPMYNNGTETGPDGIPEIGSSSVKVFPNPATDVVNITVSNNISTVQVMNYLGMIVYSENITQEKAITLNTSRYSAGNYLVQFVTNSGQTLIKKMVIIK